MNSLIPDAWAQGTGMTGNGQLAPLLMMVVFIAIFYFLLIRPQQRKAKEHQAMIAKLAAGDEVVTAGGFSGACSRSATASSRSRLPMACA